MRRIENDPATAEVDLTVRLTVKIIGAAMSTAELGRLIAHADEHGDMEKALCYALRCQQQTVGWTPDRKREALLTEIVDVDFVTLTDVRHRRPASSQRRSMTAEQHPNDQADRHMRTCLASHPTSRKLWARAYRLLFRQWPQRVVDERMAQVAACAEWYAQEASRLKLGIPGATTSWENVHPRIRNAMIRRHLPQR